MISVEILKLLLNKEFENTCTLCFKVCGKVDNIFQQFEIQNESESCYISILEAMKIMFSKLPEPVFEGICDKCTMQVLHMYIKMRKYENVTKIMSKLIDDLLKMVNEQLSLNSNNNMKVCTIKLQTENQIADQSDLKVKENNIANKENECKQDTLNQNKATLCSVCGKSFKTPYLLKKHTNSHKQEKCPYCCKLLKTNAHFKLHIKRHETGVKMKQMKKTIFKCDDCEYNSGNKSSLEAHINKIHLNVRPYLCQYCFKGFYRKSGLTEHKQTHISKVKQETCDRCGQSFVNKKCLSDHMKLHTNERSYSCDLCGKGFVSVSRRSEHVKRKHFEKLQLCRYCGKKFSLRKELNRHVKRTYEEHVSDFFGYNN